MPAPVAMRGDGPDLTRRETSLCSPLTFRPSSATAFSVEWCVALPAGASEQPAKQPASLESLSSLLHDELMRVNALIVARMHSPVALIPQLAGHIVAAGGKRLRPMLTLATSRLCGYRGERHIALATAVEFIHTATLLHDDVVDSSDLRRGLATANAVWGNKPSVLVGDFLFSRAFELMVEDGSLKILRLLSRASAVIAEGEVLQLVTSNDMATDEAAYLQVIGDKTAELFAAASRIGAVLGERSEAEEAALDAFGRNLGIAFQLIDDLLDYSARETELGKAIGDDFRDGKVTLPVLLAYRAGSETERAFWRRTLEEQDQHDGDLAHAVTLMARHGCLDATGDRASHYGEKARRALAAFPDCVERQALLEAVDFCLARGY
jgi:octaprenyl-diphosphate synthase